MSRLFWSTFGLITLCFGAIPGLGLANGPADEVKEAISKTSWQGNCYLRHPLGISTEHGVRAGRMDIVNDTGAYNRSFSIFQPPRWDRDEEGEFFRSIPEVLTSGFPYYIPNSPHDVLVHARLEETEGHRIFVVRDRNEMELVRIDNLLDGEAQLKVWALTAGKNGAGSGENGEIALVDRQFDREQASDTATTIRAESLLSNFAHASSDNEVAALSFRDSKNQLVRDLHFYESSFGKYDLADTLYLHQYLLKNRLEIQISGPYLKKYRAGRTRGEAFYGLANGNLRSGLKSKDRFDQFPYTTVELDRHPVRTDANLYVLTIKTTLRTSDDHEYLKYLKMDDQAFTCYLLSEDHPIAGNIRWDPFFWTVSGHPGGP